MRSARAATFAIFALTGAMFATWASRLPATQERLALSPGELAVALSGVELGALIGLPLGAGLTGRLGSRVALRLAFTVFPSALALVGRAPRLAALVLSLVAFAAANSVVDVAINAQGVELERRLRRPVLSGLHAGHPLGLVAGGSAGTAAAALGTGVATHFGAAAVAGLALGLAATRWLVREPAEAAPSRRGLARPGRRLLVLGLVAFCATLVTSTAENWSAVALREQHGAGQALGAATFTAYALAQAAGRLAGDRLVARHGRLRVVRTGALVAAAGAAAAVLSPGVPLAIAGWVLVGLGLAAVTPAIIGAAPRLSGMPVPSAIAAITSISYLGSFSGPPLIGGLATLAGLTAALGATILVSLVLAALAGAGLRPATAAAGRRGG
jgi:predicted MFS family arabinose efflux permease